LGSTFSATSNLGVGIGGAFSGDAGLVADVCPASPSCTWGSPSSTPPNFTAGDALVYAFDPNGSGGNGAGTGPISLTFSTPVFGAGAWIDADTNGTYTATIAAYNAGGLIFTSSGQTSDSSGDPLFLGVLDSTAEITQIVLTLTSCPGCGQPGNDTGDFAMDTLLMTDQTSSVPEPSSVLLLGSGLVGMAWTLRRRSRKSGRQVVGFGSGLGKPV
jgi:hypothetical protein